MKKDGLGKLSAVKFRAVLIASIVLIIGASSVGFWFFCQQLTTYAAEVKTANAAASTSTSDVNRLKELEKELKNDKVAVTRAKNIVADSKYYQYQDQIIADMTAYAKASGLSVTSINFEDTAAASTATPPTAAQLGPGGLKSTKATITLKNPVKYQALMRFIHATEINLTKMQISGISLVRDPTSEGIVVNPLTIEVYTR